MKTYFTLLLCLILTGEVISQNVVENQKKYWYYRYRLLNNFLLLSDGLEPGTNIPANQRGFFSGNELVWGDSPMTLGYYLGVLATEHALLAAAGLSTDSTERELFLALEAFNRLDRNAEMFYSIVNPGLPNLNGYYIREDFIDIPNPFFDPTTEDFTEPVQDHFSSGKVTSQFNNIETKSWLRDPVTQEIILSPEDPTHDQLWPMMMGLSLVSNLIPGNAIYDGRNFMDGEVSIRQEAISIALRLQSYLTANYWQILKPHTGSCIESSSPSCNSSQIPPCTSFACGANTAWAAYGAGLGFYHITGDASILSNSIFLANQPIWQSYQPIPFSLYGNNEEDKLQAILCISNSWGSGSQNNTAALLNTRAFIYNYEHFPLVLHVLFNEPTMFLPSYFENLLNSAPCQGPWFIDPNNSSPSWEWTSTDRCTKPWRRGGDSNFPGEYNGLDYMFYHNLYYLTFANASNLPPYINRMDLTINDNFPFQASGLTIGDDNNPAEFKAFRSITSTGVHTANANVSYIAGEDVDIDNADIQPGAEVSIDNQYFNCGTNWLRTAGEPEGLYGMNSGSMEHWALTQPFQVNLTHKTSSATTLPTPADQKDFSTIKVYPNPASTTITIELTSAPAIATSYKLFDAAGRLIQKGSLHNRENKVSLQGIDQGFYLLEIITTETLESFKITKYD